MQGFKDIFYEFIAELQKKRQQKRLEQLQAYQKANTSYSNGTNKVVLQEGASLNLNSKSEQKKKRMEADITKIVKTAQNDPEILLGFVQEEGTPVYRFAGADAILKTIGEEEGFITPLCGLKALYLNFIVNIIANKKLSISFKTSEMFVICDKKPDTYKMLHQFHMWYAFRIELPGYDTKTQEKFKQMYKFMNNDNVSVMTTSEVYELKEAIARDLEASDFVIKLAKEYEGAKQALNKMVSQKGAAI